MAPADTSTSGADAWMLCAALLRGARCAAAACSGSAVDDGTLNGVDHVRSTELPAGGGGAACGKDGLGCVRGSSSNSTGGVGENIAGSEYC